MFVETKEAYSGFTECDGAAATPEPPEFVALATGLLNAIAELAIKPAVMIAGKARPLTKRYKNLFGFMESSLIRGADISGSARW